MAKKTKWGSKLSKAKGLWKKGEKKYKEEFASKALPEDTYVAQLSNVGFDEKDGKIFINRTYLIIEGDFKGSKVGDRAYFTKDTSIAMFKQWLALLGYDASCEIEDLEDIFVEINEDCPTVKIKVTQGDFTNVNVQSLISTDDAGDHLDGVDDYENDEDDDQSENDYEDDGDDEEEGEDVESEDDPESESEEDGEEDEDDEEEVDLESMDKKQLVALVQDNDLDPVKDLGFKNKSAFSRSSDKKIREALYEYYSNDEGEEETGDTEEMDALLEECKMFCASNDIEFEDDTDLDDFKSLITEAGPFKASDLADDEKSLLEDLELSELIKVKKTTAKKKTRKRVKK